MVSLLIYLSTTALLPHFAIIFALFFSIKNNYYNYFKVNHTELANLLILSALIVLSFLNSIFHLTHLESLSNLFPYVFLSFLSFFLAKHLSIKDIKILVVLVFIEAIIGIIEFLLNINSVLFWKDFYETYQHTNMLYFKKVFGLSENSSNLSLKILGTILLIDYFKLFKTKPRIVIKSVLFIGLVLSFQRTAISAIIIYYLFIYLIKFGKVLYSIKLSINYKVLLKRFTQIIFAVGILLTINLYFNKISKQYTKGSDKIELSGRERIWPKYVNFISHNILFGYYSQKYRVDYNGEKKVAHAHNSFLQVLANHGIIIFLLYLILLFFNINRGNILFIGILIILSLFQYALFWGISLIDIIFFIFALKPRVIEDNTEPKQNE